METKIMANQSIGRLFNCKDYGEGKKLVLKYTRECVKDPAEAMEEVKNLDGINFKVLKGLKPCVAEFHAYDGSYGTGNDEGMDSWHIVDGLEGLKSAISEMFSQVVEKSAGLIKGEKGLYPIYDWDFNVFQYPSGRIRGDFQMYLSILSDNVMTDCGAKDGVTLRYYECIFKFHETSGDFKIR